MALEMPEARGAIEQFYVRMATADDESDLSHVLFALGRELGGAQMPDRIRDQLLDQVPLLVLAWRETRPDLEARRVGVSFTRRLLILADPVLVARQASALIERVLDRTRWTRSPQSMTLELDDLLLSLHFADGPYVTRLRERLEPFSGNFH
ncbi:hypothetical protein JI739_13405 [Ramlibacter sp. AW1]|uniref:Uncharacterized protein n=1 Tax=Ramlibacter aurantiacus TaxID=2801330 RepID=A0A936ZPG6_9BURK|nr:hypothetical protein [Ramlibacter aurantiacus]MBL0421351.1 hypothetical protein [Ramlibacter aurantiacus]